MSYLEMEAAINDIQKGPSNEAVPKILSLLLEMVRAIEVVELQAAIADREAARRFINRPENAPLWTSEP